MFILTPNFAASSISSRETPFGVNMMDSGLKPANNPSYTSCIDTVSKPLPRLFINLNIVMLDSALAA